MTLTWDQLSGLQKHRLVARYVFGWTTEETKPGERAPEAPWMAINGYPTLFPELGPVYDRSSKLWADRAIVHRFRQYAILPGGWTTDGEPLIDPRWLQDLNAIWWVLMPMVHRHLFSVRQNFLMRLQELSTHHAFEREAQRREHDPNRTLAPASFLPTGRIAWGDALFWLVADDFPRAAVAACAAPDLLLDAIPLELAGPAEWTEEDMHQP